MATAYKVALLHSAFRTYWNIFEVDVLMYEHIKSIESLIPNTWIKIIFWSISQRIDNSVASLSED